MLQYWGDFMEDVLRHVTQFYSAKWKDRKFPGQICLE